MRLRPHAALMTFTMIALAAASASAQQAVAPTNPRPMLEELNRETEALYKQVGGSLLRVQVPQPRWMSDYAMAPLKDHLDKLDPVARRRLERELSAGPTGAAAMALLVRPTTLPAPAATQPVKIDGQGTVLFVTPDAVGMEQELVNQRNAVLGAHLELEPTNAAAFTPNNIGLLLDDQGHILIPLYIERETADATPVKLSTGDGKLLDARFVGSDRQTNLTLVQSEKSAGRAVALSTHKPVDGSLVLYVSTLDGSGRLGLWNGSEEECGLVFTTDGGVAGIARNGQFLNGSACHLIAEQLIQFGAVRRATLGVIVREIRKDDPLRDQMPALGSKTAMRIEEVISHSAADKAGIKQGDVLLALAGQAVTDIPSLAVAIASRSGATEFQVLRGNEVLKLNVDLEQQK